MDFLDAIIYNVLGQYGVTIVIGVMMFILVFRYSRDFFNWVDDRTYKNREYIIEKLEFLFITYDADKITYILLGLSFGVGVITSIIFALLGNWVLGLILGTILGVIGWKIPRPIINFMVSKRIKGYESQMVDGLQLLANALRAGQSLSQGLGMVVDELPNPISNEFNHMLQQNKIGVPIEECFDELVKRIPTEDNEMFVTSVNILHETGGNLPETFDTIIEVIRERIRLKQKIDSFTAQGLTQGGIIASMPFVIGAMYGVSDPKTMSLLFTTPIGWVALFIVISLDALGCFIIYKIVKIKV